MRPMKSLEKALSFKTERFDYRSELPKEYNAGNRFYGRDVAAFLTDQLNAGGIKASYLDEDWGWYVEAQTPSAVEVEIAVYNINEHGCGGKVGKPEWGLWIRAFQRTKLLGGLISKRRAMSVPGEIEELVVAAIRSVGGSPADWVE